MRLSLRELELYDRQLRLEPDGREIQRRLKESTALIAGVGGLGCVVAMNLAGMGVGRLILVDHDRVSVSDFQRQHLYRFSDLGKPKASAAARALRRRNPFIEVVGMDMPLGDALRELSKERIDVVLDCLDSYEARLLLNAFAVRNNIPLVHGAVRGYKGEVMSVLPRKTACLACISRPRTPAQPVPVAAPIVTIIGAIEASEAFKILTNIGPPLFGRLLRFDCLTYSFKIYEAPRRADCPVCGSQA